MHTKKLVTYIFFIGMIVFFTFNFLLIGHAIRIILMNPSNGAVEYSYGGFIYHTAYVRTSQDLDSVEWYVDGELVYTDIMSNNSTESYFSPYWLEGSLQGDEYLITAVAISSRDEDRDGNADTHSRSYVLQVWKPTVEGLTPNHTNTSGYVEISRLYYDPASPGYAISDGTIHAVNLSNTEDYTFDYGGRLSVTRAAPDEKVHEWDQTLSQNGTPFDVSIGLSMNLTARDAPVGVELTMFADYWININGVGIGADNVDTCRATASFPFTHKPQ